MSGPANTTGDDSQASTTGNDSAASTTGNRSAASTTGHRSAPASTTGNRSAASTTGKYSAASTTGHGSAASTTGYGSAASTTGNGSEASTTGYGSAATTTGNGSEASTTGYGSQASTTGHYSQASTTGYCSAAFAAHGAASASHGVAVGRWVRLSITSEQGAVVLPTSGYVPFVVTLDDGWPADTWITMSDTGTVETHPDVLAFDNRGYVLRWTADDGYTAGCRQFATSDEAVAHWSNPDHEAPDSAAILLDAVKAHAAKQVAS